MCLKMLCMLLLLALRPFGSVAQSTTEASCSPDLFSFPQILGAEPLSISAIDLHNYRAFSLAPGSDRAQSYTINFCNVNVTYTHPGWNDTIHVSVWLPSARSWTGRLQALGGGGYSASFGELYMTQAVARGDVAIDTDAGHAAGMDTAQSPREWALTSPGNVNLYLLEDFASRSLHEMAVIGKSIAQDFYDTKPRYTFFSGCSQGGRQGLMLAQKYPEDFDGILAAAPAISLDKFIPAGYWAQQVMKNIGIYPLPCEIDAFTRAAIDSCDEFDGVKDNIIAKPALCHFQASDIVGQTFLCDGTNMKFTAAGAKIVQAAWDGPPGLSGSSGWFGLNKDASLTHTYIQTECNPNKTCSAAPIDLLTDWIKYFVAKDPDFVVSEMTNEQYFAYLRQSEAEYHSMMSATDPDLSRFRAAGGKMISWHGLADQVIPPEGTIAYYQRVLDLDASADLFYRFYEAPGVGHCFGGPGHIPNDAFDQLVAWVENETVPDTLLAVNADGHLRELCPYPSEQTYIGGDSTKASSFRCVDPVMINNRLPGWSLSVQSRQNLEEILP